MSTAPAQPTSFADCPFCGLNYYGRPNQCRRCGMLLNEAAEDAGREMKAGRRRVVQQKALSDTFFLVGLLLGGPMMTIGQNLRLGLFIALAGAIASVLRRYSNWSTPGTLGVATLIAVTIATSLVDPGVHSVEDELAAEAARAAFVQALSEADNDLLAETRGAGHLAVWFSVPADRQEECGDFPPTPIREHLGELGFLRIVVADRNQGGGLCSFAP